MKRILGLDLGTTSIGWAYIGEAENDNEESQIIKTGVRVVPLSTDEQNDFKRGKSITINADRTLKRGARRNLQRYKLRRKVLIKILNEIGFINDSTKLAENSKDSTHSTYNFRAKATSQKLSKEEFARVLLMINKKRGYKSSRKANNEEEGQLIDGMAIAKRLQNESLNPGQLSLLLLKEGKKMLPDYYRSDLQAEFDAIWNFQKQFYPTSLMPHHKEALEGLGQQASGKYFEKTIGTERAENKGAEKKLRLYEWRAKAISEKMDLKEVAYVLTEVNNKINQSSGYLGAISDRSKELYFDNLTVGQYLYNQLKKNPNTSLKNQVFYRQDYMDEFDAIWTEQSKHYPELTEKIKDDIRNITIFYQRPLKSQKGLINICELESVEREVLIDGVKKTKEIGPRVIPKSSPLFQQFKIWQNINSIRVSAKDKTLEVYHIEEDTKKDLFEMLNCVENVSDKDFLKWLFENSEKKPESFKVNFKKLEGNRTQSALLKKYEKIVVDIEGYTLDFKKLTGLELINSLKSIFETIGITPNILEFNPTLQGNDFAKQPSYELWHLLYSYTDDTSETGTKSLIEKLQSKFGFKEQHARLLINVTFQQDYGSLSARAIKKIYPFLEDGKRYDEACALAGYNHSNSVTKEDKKSWKPQELKILQKNSLRNPVVEKILNQMIHVVNGIIESPEMGRPEEIRVELARELKKTAEQRGEMTKSIERATKDHENLREKIKKEFGIPYVSRKDLIKYKLYRELKVTGYKTLYSGTYIKPEDLFTNKFDVEHIIPQSVLFDDSFSNKTLELRDSNLEKGNETAIDYCERKGWLSDFKDRVEEVFKDKDGIGYMKRKKLLMTKEEIPEGFLNRDLGNSAYIAKKAIQLLQVVSKDIVSTSGTITAKLRSDWELINVLQELNWGKYEALGLTYYQTNKNGKKLPRIKDWTKRNDHRHHAMDAIAVAFTKRAFIQYLNNDSGKSSKGFTIEKIKEKYTFRDKEGGRKFIKPFPTIREESKKHLERILISHKAKNKVVTNNKNKIKVDGGHLIKKELTPRGQLHKETIYGKSIEYNTKIEKIGSAFDEEKIATVAKKKYRELLLKRLQEFDGDAKKAFTGKNSLSKNPITLNVNGAVLPDKVKTVVFEDRFTIRKEITPDLKIDKVVDVGVRKILQKRLDDFNGKPKEAFVNLDDNPIWLNKEKTIPLKRVTITGVRNAESLHHKKNHLGTEILDKKGNKIPSDYVELGNNHHIAIFKSPEGELKEEAVSFYEAVIRKNHSHPIINSHNNEGWPLLFTMKQNEMFVFPSSEFDPDDIDLTDLSNMHIISPNLYRVQSVSSRYYIFRHHLETTAANGDTFKNQKRLAGKTYHFYQSEKYLAGAKKVRLNHLGDIVQVGE